MLRRETIAYRTPFPVMNERLILFGVGEGLWGSQWAVVGVDSVPFHNKLFAAQIFPLAIAPTVSSTSIKSSPTCNPLSNHFCFQLWYYQVASSQLQWNPFARMKAIRVLLPLVIMGLSMLIRGQVISIFSPLEFVSKLSSAASFWHLETVILVECKWFMRLFQLFPVPIP